MLMNKFNLLGIQNIKILKILDIISKPTFLVKSLTFFK